MNKMHKKNILYGSLLLCSAFMPVSCIDEDLSDCPPPAKDVELTYRLEISQDVSLGFSNEVNSLHLGFWDTPTTLYREWMLGKADLPDDMIFRVTIPVDDYSHVAVANSRRADGSYLPYSALLSDAVLSQPYLASDTVAGTSQPMYAGILRMEMKENSEIEHYEVLLKPVSGKYLLHIRHPETLKDMRCYISGTRQSYACWRQEWGTDPDLVTDASSYAATPSTGATDFSFYAFPTSTVTGTKVAGDAPAAEWKLYLYSRLGDKTVQHVFTIREGVAPGDVFEATFNVTEQGGEAVDVEAGVAFDPDWKPGNDYDTEM